MVTKKKAAKPISKKPASKKTAVKKVVSKKAVKASKPLAKKALPKKVSKSVKKTAPVKKPVTPIKKSAPAKKLAKQVVKKALPKKVSKSVKKTAPVKKPVTPIKKSAPAKKLAKQVVKKALPKKTSPKKPLSKKVAKPIKKTTPVKKSSIRRAPEKKSATPINKKAASVKKPVKSSGNFHNKKEQSKKVELKPLPKAKDIKVPPPKPIVLPKITATKARKYEPGFTKSVLDQAPQENNGPTMRYSDSELTEFRELIQRKLETAKKELGYLQGLITRKDEMGGDDTDNRYMTMEDGSLSMEREQLSQMASRQITFIDHLEKAMMRIENKTYGICRVTGKLIDKARLRAVPHATLCIEAKMGIAK